MHTTYTTHLLHHTRRVLGQNIYHLRCQRKMPMAKLARISGLPVQLLDRYEIGKSDIRLEEMLRIACALKVEMRELLH